MQNWPRNGIIFTRSCKVYMTICRVSMVLLHSLLLFLNSLFLESNLQPSLLSQTTRGLAKGSWRRPTLPHKLLVFNVRITNIKFISKLNKILFPHLNTLLKSHYFTNKWGTSFWNHLVGTGGCFPHSGFKGKKTSHGRFLWVIFH